MSTAWLYATTTVPTVSLISLTAWAALTTALAAWQRRHCYRWHYGVGGGAAWDGQAPATTPDVADGGREQEKAAS